MCWLGTIRCVVWARQALNPLMYILCLLFCINLIDVVIPRMCGWLSSWSIFSYLNLVLLTEHVCQWNLRMYYGDTWLECLDSIQIQWNNSLIWILGFRNLTESLSCQFVLWTLWIQKLSLIDFKWSLVDVSREMIKNSN